MFSQKLHSVIGQVNNTLQFSIVHIQKIHVSVLPLQKELGFPMGEGRGGGGFCKTKYFKEMCEALFLISRGVGES